MTGRQSVDREVNRSIIVCIFLAIVAVSLYVFNKGDHDKWLAQQAAAERQRTSH